MDWATAWLATGAATTSGIKLYATILTLGLLQRFHWVELPAEWRTWVLALVGALCVVEFIADKIPVVDSIWDGIHTFIRIPAGAVLMASAFAEVGSAARLLAGLLGGGLALTTHSAKATARLAANTSQRRVCLMLSPGVRAPGVWGLWRPVVVLPKRLVEGFSDDEVEALVMHEVIHVKRWDNLVSLFQGALTCVLWFYPVVWFLDKKLLQEREQACDEEFLQGKDPKCYISSILKVVRFGIASKMAGVSSVRIQT